MGNTESSNYTWVPFYEELAQKLLQYRIRQPELIMLLEKYRGEGLSITPLLDKGVKGQEFLPTELDPFTFMGTYNRGGDENRIALCKRLKEDFQLKCPAPTDFTGVPKIDARNSFFVAYKQNRNPSDIETLWAIFNHIFVEKPLVSSEFEVLFEKCLGIKQTGPANLTMGLFWAKPKELPSLDYKMMELIGITGKLRNAQEYLSYCSKVYKLSDEMNTPIYELSHQAHLNSTQPKADSSIAPLKTNEVISKKVTPYSEVVGELTSDEIALKTGLDKETVKHWIAQLNRKQQIILQGPPGTGKTFIADLLAKHIAGTDGLTELVQFHPSYSYEDFMQGFRPTLQDGHMTFEQHDGVFKQFCHKAESMGNTPCVLVIDEINRANLSSVLGELMYLLEYRDGKIKLPSGELFSIPPNVYIIGTMNTADRSIAMMDYALRRRFAFVFIPPSPHVLYHHLKSTDINVSGLVSVLEQIETVVDDKHYALGHSFFLSNPDLLALELPDIWRFEIEPYLEEYFYDQPDKVEPFRWQKISKTIIRDDNTDKELGLDGTTDNASRIPVYG